MAGNEKLKNNVYNEPYVDSNFDAQAKRKVSEFNLSSFYNVLEKGLWKGHNRNSHKRVDGAALSQKVVR